MEEEKECKSKNDGFLEKRSRKLNLETALKNNQETSRKQCRMRAGKSSVMILFHDNIHFRFERSQKTCHMSIKAFIAKEQNNNFFQNLFC